MMQNRTELTSRNEKNASRKPERSSMTLAHRVAASKLRRPRHWQLQHHARSHSFDRGHRYLAAVGFDDLLDDVEAEAGAAAAAERFVAALLVLVPDLLQLGGLDAHAAVGHGDGDGLGELAVADDLRADGDQPLLRRELQGIRDQI